MAVDQQGCFPCGCIFFTAAEGVDDRLDRVLGSLSGIPDAVTVLVREQVLQTAVGQIVEFGIGLIGLHSDEGFHRERSCFHAPGKAPAIKGCSVGFQVPVDASTFPMSELQKQRARVGDVIGMAGRCGGDGIVADQ